MALRRMEWSTFDLALPSVVYCPLKDGHGHASRHVMTGGCTPKILCMSGCGTAVKISTALNPAPLKCSLLFDRFCKNLSRNQHSPPEICPSVLLAKVIGVCLRKR